MEYVIAAILGAVWLLLLRILKKAGLQAWYITAGMAGFFILMMVFVRPVITQPLAQTVAALAGLVGRLTGHFEPYFKYGILFITTPEGSMTLQIDFECSGVIEIIIYLTIILFFRVDSVSRRLVQAVLGSLYLLAVNALRIVLICEMVHFGGTTMYYVAHTYIGRIFFYAASVALYFYVLTKPQIESMKVGSFAYSEAGSNGLVQKDGSGGSRREAGR